MKLFLTSSNNFVTTDIVKHLDRSPADLRLTFIPTAGEVEKGDLQWLNDDRQALVDAGFKVQDFTLTGKTKAQVKAMLAETDFVFVSGGNTFYLLQEMRKSGFSELIQPYLERVGIMGVLVRVRWWLAQTLVCLRPWTIRVWRRSLRTIAV